MVHIERVRISYLHPIREIELTLDKNVNVLIGPNACGKSTILRAIASRYIWGGSLNEPMSELLETEEDYPPEDYTPRPPLHMIDHYDLEQSRTVNERYGEDMSAHSDDYYRNVIAPDSEDGYFGDDDNDDNIVSLAPEMIDVPWEIDVQASADWTPASWDAAPLLFVPASRVNFPPRPLFPRDDAEESAGPSTIGNERFPNKNDFNYFESARSGRFPIHEFFSASDGTFDGPALKELLEKLQAFEDDPLGIAQLKRVKIAVENCVKTICSEVVLPSESPRVDLDIQSNDYHEGTLGKRLPIGELSSGTQGTFLWVWALALVMAEHHRWEDGWETRPAVLLIDDIDNHLHPTWQRRVIPTLLENFPGLQIFATTHSPFLVAGLRRGQAHLLKRDSNGMVTASTNDHDIIGWPTDEILRTFMGVDEPTDQLTVDRANRLRELRGKDTLSDAETEEVNELRRQVNEDFISSSTPLEAQRELYGVSMLEFLRSQQSELSQDGS